MISRCRLSLLTWIIEAVINKLEAVSRSIMFGRGQFNTGIIIEPADAGAFDFTEERSRNAYIDEIW